MLSVTGQSTAPQYDGRGNMTRDHQGQTYEYDHYNRLSGVGTSIDLTYDPAGRLQETSGTGITFREMQYDGLDLIAEYDGSGTLTARYVHGPGADEPLVQYAGASVSTRQWLLADERGSIVAVTDWSGAAIQINSYDEYGAPAPGNAGRFGYTGQVWLPETGLYHYKNRAYHPELGRFMQTDPIGVNGGMNLYAYVGGDPVNFVDPLGLRQEDTGPPPCNPPNCEVVTVTVPELDDPCRGFCMPYEDVLEALYGGDPWTIGVPVYDFYDLHGNYLGGVSEQSCNQGLVDAGNAMVDASNFVGATSFGLIAFGSALVLFPEASTTATGVAVVEAGVLASYLGVGLHTASGFLHVAGTGRWQDGGNAATGPAALAFGGVAGTYAARSAHSSRYMFSRTLQGNQQASRAATSASVGSAIDLARSAVGFLTPKKVSCD